MHRWPPIYDAARGADDCDPRVRETPAKAPKDNGRNSPPLPGQVQKFWLHKMSRSQRRRQPSTLCSSACLSLHRPVRAMKVFSFPMQSCPGAWGSGATSARRRLDSWPIPFWTHPLQRETSCGSTPYPQKYTLAIWHQNVWRGETGLDILE